MERAFILYTSGDANRNGVLIDKYKNACASYGIEARLVLTDKADAFAVVTAERPAFVINRTRDAELADLLRGEGVFVTNPPELTRTANDKLLTYRLLNRRVPMMLTVPAEAYAAGEAPCMEYPFVIKPRGGHGGGGVELISSAADFKKYREANDISGCIVQKVASEVGRDMRVYVVGGRPVACMLRVSKDDFRSNYCLGGSARIVPVSALAEDELAIIEGVCSALPLHYAGVDIMRDRGRAVLNELEDPVGARMLYTYTDVDPAELHTEFVLRNY